MIKDFDSKSVASNDFNREAIYTAAQTKLSEFDFSGYLYNIRPLFTANMFLVTNFP